MAVGAVMQAFLPIMLLGGFIGLAVALFFVMLILAIVAAMFMVIGQILDLLLDEFDHYQGDAPSDDNTSSDPDDLPEEPDEECPISGPLSGEISSLEACADDDMDDCMLDCLAQKFWQASHLSAAAVKSALKTIPKLARLLSRGKSGSSFGLGEAFTIIVVAICLFTRYCVLALAAIAGAVWNPMAWVARCGIECSLKCALNE